MTPPIDANPVLCAHVKRASTADLIVLLGFFESPRLAPQFETLIRIVFHELVVRGYEPMLRTCECGAELTPGGYCRECNTPRIHEG